jgi:hypothetical protein
MEGVRAGVLGLRGGKARVLASGLEQHYDGWRGVAFTSYTSEAAIAAIDVGIILLPLHPSPSTSVLPLSSESCPSE